VPALQRGSAFRTKNGWGVRWRENGRRPQQVGFGSRTEALDWWDDEVKPRLRGGAPPRPDVTLREHAERYLRVHGCAPRTKQALREQLGLPEHEPLRPRELDYLTAMETFGDRLLRDLEHAGGEIAEWTSSLPKPQQARKLAALKQILTAAVAWDLLAKNPASVVTPAKGTRVEIDAFADTEELDAVTVEIGAPWDALVTFASETGLRPEEWAALERRDVDRRAGVLHVQRAYSVGAGLKAYGKTSRSLRAVPLTDRALEALDTLPLSLATPLLFPTYAAGYRDGVGYGKAGHLNLANWRKRHWRPALQSAGLERDGALWLPKPYALRHTFATWALDAGFDVFELARLMGTSVVMIDKVYGHLAKGHAERARERLNRRPSIVTVEDAADHAR
jgi:integrase